MQNETIEQKVKEYVAFTVGAISNMKPLSKLIRDGELDPNQINFVLAEYTNILLGLINIQDKFVNTIELYETEFDKWFDPKYIELRNEINKDRIASKLATKEEIRIQVKVKYAEQYYEFQEHIRELKAKERYYGKLIKTWEREENVLRTISNNLRTEMSKIDFSYIIDRNKLQDNTGYKNSVVRDPIKEEVIERTRQRRANS